MNQKSRYIFFNSKRIGGYSVEDNQKEMPTILFQSEEQALKFFYHLQQQEQIIKTLSEQLSFIQNSISNSLNHQKSEIGKKVLQEVIEDYNEWMLGHKEEK